MAVELGTGYITLVPSARGITAGIQSELGAPLEQAAKDSGKKTSSAFSGSFASGASKLKNVLLGAIGAGSAIEIGKSIAEATGKEEAANARLATALRDSRSGWQLNNSAIEEAVKSGEHYGNTAAQTKTALATLTTALGSPAKALKDLGLAQNLAATTGRPLTDVTVAIAKAQEGQLRPLKQLGIDLPVVAGGAQKLATAQSTLQKSQGKLFLSTSAWHTALANEKLLIASTTSTQAQRAAADKKVVAAYTAMQKASLGVRAAQANVNAVQGAGAKIVDLLGQKIKGSAAAQAQTFAGKLKALHATLDDLEARIGQAVIPTLVRLGTGIAAVVGFFQSGSTAAHVLAVVIAASAAGFVAYKAAVLTQAAATAVATTAQKLFGTATEETDAALAANPIGLVVAALVALGVVIFEAYKHFGPFRDVVNAVWGALKATFNWVRTNWPLLLAILTGPFGVAVLLIVRNWSTITGFFSALPGRIGRFLARVGTDIAAPFKAGYDWLSRNVFAPLLNWFSGLPGKIGGFLGGLASALTSPFRTAFDAIARLWNGTVGKLSFHLPSWIPGIGGKGFSMPTLPILDSGGVVTGPTLALLAATSKAQPEIASPVGLMAATFRKELQRVNGGRTIDASITVHGSVFGVDDLDAWADKRDRKLAQTLAAGAAA